MKNKKLEENITNEKNDKELQAKSNTTRQSKAQRKIEKQEEKTYTTGKIHQN